MTTPTLVWFRQDLRVQDHAPLYAAAQRGAPVIPLFIWSSEEEGKWVPGGASCWWLHHALESLQAELKTFGLELLIRNQPSLKALLKVIQESGADHLFFHRRYEPYWRTQEKNIQSTLEKQGITTQAFHGSLLFEPEQILNKKKQPFQIFTPFWKSCLQAGTVSPPVLKPCSLVTFKRKLNSENLSHLNLLPTIPWDQGLKKQWDPSLKGAKTQLDQVLKSVIGSYSQTRDFPGLLGTSQLSPYLHYGQLSIRMVWQAVIDQFGEEAEGIAYRRQLGWREFSHYLLFHFPHTSEQSYKPLFQSFPWQANQDALKRWQKGQTGYPFVDAGMRQLWEIGWMHNRLRMLVASFLVKDLLIDWVEGARWFWDTLVDADLANNTLGWQWVAGTGVDAAPYFRLFNPVTQGEKFDAEGTYIKQWIPELRSLPARWIHRPWEAPKKELDQAGIVLGIDYPLPIINHEEARKKALKIYKYSKVIR